ncbi:NUDIX hydrolase [Actinosynnema pretiosum subsp. pretiosum]|uniref:NUDIX hydrolase n=1 Tax=Actinosynnema pretiosum subsp. pretiosum TaxID=103721 RepID=A0AA45L417_9PSEU|nr:putative Nudix-like regulator [Actinosynnema pretiosum subsp. pretiosum]QUF02708.1 NUDIX hydrolase [Actinosynnema pretiosum subsp. pretiosum]
MARARRKREPVFVTVDLVVLTVLGGRLSALLVERVNDPFQGWPALPGGYVRGRETLEETARRELAEETGLTGVLLEQVGVHSDPDRDPSGRVITCAFLAIVPRPPLPVAGSDASAVGWVPVDEVGELAFDHAVLLRDAVERARDRLQFTGIATAFCADEFTVADLREVYEAVWGVRLDKPNFHRKVTEVPGFLVPTGEKRATGAGRPAALYRAGRVDDLLPPMMRPRT